jgi:hypothetical protein
LRRVTKAFTVATAGLAAMTATAEAATLSISPVKACYLTGESDALSGTGYTPNGTVNLSVDGQSIFSLQADASGNIATQLQFGSMNAVKTHTLTATDATNPATMGSVAFVGTTHQVATPSSRAGAGKKFKLRGYGFIFGPKAYMHVRGHGIKTNTFLKRPKAPCGTFTVRKRLVRAGAPLGKYRVQFDAKKRFSKRTRPRLVYELTVFRTFSAAAAGAFALPSSSGWAKLSG